jgi:hypothetical protein
MSESDLYSLIQRGMRFGIFEKTRVLKSRAYAVSNTPNEYSEDREEYEINEEVVQQIADQHFASIRRVGK